MRICCDLYDDFDIISFDSFLYEESFEDQVDTNLIYSAFLSISAFSFQFDLIYFGL